MASITVFPPSTTRVATVWLNVSLAPLPAPSKKLLNGEDRLWDYHVPAVQFFINCKIAALHKSSPFSVMFCREMRPFGDSSSDSSSPISYSYDEVKRRFRFANEVLFPAVRDATQSHVSRAIQSFARTKRILKEPFPAGTSVMVVDPTRSRKTQPVYEGPFKVAFRNRGGAYHLIDSDGTPFQRKVSASMLKVVVPNPAHDSVSFVVDHIIGHRGSNSRREYLVRWKSKPRSEDSWESVSNFNDLSCIHNYWSSRSPSLLGGGNVVPPSKPGHSRSIQAPSHPLPDRTSQPSTAYSSKCATSPTNSLTASSVPTSLSSTSYSDPSLRTRSSSPLSDSAPPILGAPSDTIKAPPDRLAPVVLPRSDATSFVSAVPRRSARIAAYS